MLTLFERQRVAAMQTHSRMVFTAVYFLFLRKRNIIKHQLSSFEWLCSCYLNHYEMSLQLSSQDFSLGQARAWRSPHQPTFTGMPLRGFLTDELSLYSDPSRNRKLTNHKVLRPWQEIQWLGSSSLQMSRHQLYCSKNTNNWHFSSSCHSPLINEITFSISLIHASIFIPFILNMW